MPTPVLMIDIAGAVYALDRLADQPAAWRLTKRIGGTDPNATEYIVRCVSRLWSCTCRGYRSSRSRPATCKHVDAVRHCGRVMSPRPQQAAAEASA
jgi:hypothetical protein